MNALRPSIAAAVVTYNRKALLHQNLEALSDQSDSLDEIIVVDNCSTDGTRAMLESEFTSVTVVRLNSNEGFGAGVAAGMRLAYEKNHDWVWVMDDDGIPRRDALASLRNSIRTLGPGGYCLYSAYVDPGETAFCEPIRMVEADREIVSQKFDELRKSKTLVQGLGGPFLGILVPRDVILTIGLPRPDTFIWGDFEYLERMRRQGIKIYYDLNSVLYHPTAAWVEWRIPVGIFTLRRPVWKTYAIPVAPPWKYYYGIRNTMDFKLRHDRETKVVAHVKALFLGVLMSLLMVSNSRQKGLALKCCALGFWDALIGRMGKRFSPDSVGAAPAVPGAV